MTDTCPVCGRGTVEVFEADDGELGTRMVDHIPCVRVMQANSRIAAAERDSLLDTLGDRIEALEADRDRYRDLFKRANAEKRLWRQSADDNPYLAVCENCGRKTTIASADYVTYWSVDDDGVELCDDCNGVAKEARDVQSH